MKLLSVIAATAAAAAVAAVLSLPAGAQQTDESAATIAACLRSHGAADAPSADDPYALKRWVGAHSDDAAVGACLPQSKAPAQLLSCLRGQGLNPPGDIQQLKPWMARQDESALHACGVDMHPPDKAPGPGTCGKPAQPADATPEIKRS
jgi:hypothetical protein